MIAKVKGPLLPPAYFLVSLLLMVCLYVALPAARVIPSPLRYGGILIVAAGLALILWAAGLFQQAETTIKPFQRSSTLVRTGPYRLTRNPMYAGMAGVLIGVGLLLGSAWPFLVVPLFVALIQWRFIRAEEASLQQSFGSAYNEYRSRVRRWL